MTDPVPYHYPPQPGSWEKDASHLGTLAICHYVWGALTIVLSSIFVVHIVMGLALLRNPNAFTPTVPTPPANATTVPAFQPPGMPPFAAWMFVGMGSCAILLGWATGILTIVSGRCIARRRSRALSLVMAGVNCLSVPVGTTLGVFTFIVLLRPSVQALYDQGKPAPPG